MKLFHGTSEKNYDKILHSGLQSPSHLTDELTEASMWAEKKSKFDSFNSAVLEVETPYACLRLDSLKLVESVNYPDHIIEQYDPDFIAKKEYEAKREKGMSHKEIIDWALRTSEAVECVCDIPKDKINRIE